MSHWNDPAVVVACAGVAIALLYTVLTGFIWHATWQNTKATKQMIEATQRPYLGIMGVRVIRPEFNGGAWKLGVEIGNVGTVPSRNVEADFAITYLDGLTEQARRDVEAVTSALFPTQTLTLSTEPDSRRNPTLTEPGIRVTVSVRYKGATETQYTTSGEYRSNQYPAPFVTLAGHFD